MSSRRSSESGTSVDSEVILEAERLETERLALKELEQTLSKPVAFAVRTNVSFDGAIHGTTAPSPTYVVSFESREFLHIKKRFNRDWWIGRRVHIGSPLGFIPSAYKLEELQLSATASFNIHPSTAAVNGGGATPTEGTLERGKTKSGDGDRRFPAILTSRARQSESPPLLEIADGYDETEDYRDGQHGLKSSQQQGISTKKGPHQLPGQAVKRRGFSRKPGFVAPYEIVPCMRPVVFVGPALKGYDVTDMMQKAIFDAMKKHFDGRIIVSRISTNITLAKRVGALLHLDKKNVKERARNEQSFTLLAVQKDLEKIFHLASKMQLLLLDCDTINHPNQISKTCIAPIVIYIKIASIRVLNRLIKTRGKLQKKNAGVQTAAAEKLLQCPNEAFEFVVEQNTLGAATEALCNFLESYWEATHPPIALSKVERLLGSKNPEHLEPDSDKPLVPITPGHPGLSVVTKSALSAGFTNQEITSLTGARAAGWVAENGGIADNELGLTGVHHNVGNVDCDNGQDIQRLQEDQGLTNFNDANTAAYPLSGDKRIHVGAAHAAAMVAMAAGLSPRAHAGQTSAGGHRHFFRGIGEMGNGIDRSSPSLAMGIGMGLASGVAATINAALFQRSNHNHSSQDMGPVVKVPPNQATVAAAAASVRPPPLEELGIHQVESSDGTHVYQSRSARQAKQREAELERVRREAEAKVLAFQSTVAGRRRRRRDRRPHDDTHMEAEQWQAQGGDKGYTEDAFEYPPTNFSHKGLASPFHAGENYKVNNGRVDEFGMGPVLSEMSRVFPVDDDDE